MAKLAIGELSAMEILSASKNPATRTYLSFMGSRPKRVVGGAVAWKGVRGIENVRRINAGVAKGIDTARRLSQAHRETGVAVVSKTRGGMTVVPMKCAMMMEDAGSGTVIQRLGSVDQAIQMGYVKIRA